MKNNKKCPKVELKVNGKKVALNPFVKELLFSAISGLIKPLRGIKSIKTISLKSSAPKINK
jgi:hypothetical protein